MEMQVRRIVTGHDEQGRSIVEQDGAPRAEQLGDGGPVFHEVWSTSETPAHIGAAEAPGQEGLKLLPPCNGSRIRFIDFPPEDEGIAGVKPEVARASFALLGAPEVAMHRDGNSPHPFMHRTETVDYGIVLEGEIVLVLDESETIVRAGDVIVQRGTNHAWANRSARNCRMAFILLDGTFNDDPPA